MESPDARLLPQTLGPYCQWISRPASRPDFSDEVPFPVAVNQAAISIFTAFIRAPKVRKKAQGEVYMMKNDNANAFFSRNGFCSKPYAAGGSVFLPLEQLQRFLQLGILFQSPLVGRLDFNLRREFDRVIRHQTDPFNRFPLGQEIFETGDLNS